MLLLDDLSCALALQHLDPRPLALDGLSEVDLDGLPRDAQPRAAAADLPARGSLRPRARLAPDRQLNEVAAAAPKVTPGALEMAAELGRTQVSERVDRGDGAVQDAPEVEVSHVREHDLAAQPCVAEPPRCQLHHRGRVVQANDLEAAPCERFEHVTTPAAGLEDAVAGPAEPLDQPCGFLLEIPVEREVVEVRVLSVEPRQPPPRSTLDPPTIALRPSAKRTQAFPLPS